jgi:hypothetical protein
MQHCSDCRYFVDHTQMGQCRRYPTYQNRHRNEWCGELAVVDETSPSLVEGAFLPVVDVPQVEKRKPGRPKKND